MPAMNAPLAFAIGMTLGAAAGIVMSLWLARRGQQETSRVVEALSARVVQQQAAQILELAETKLTGKKEAIDGTLKTMKDDLGKVENLMRALEKDREAKFGKIDTRLENAASVIKDLTSTANSLKQALAGNSNRGQWGERMAEDVLRLAGMVEGINYVKQTTLQESGSRPDFTFLLPQKLTLHMDVKFPFANYQLYTDAKTETERERHKKDFLKDVRLRIKELQSRNYVNPEGNTMDYVLLFIPNEQVFSFINEADRTLVDEAMQAKTILCSPLSLYAILAVVRQSIDNFRMESKSKEMLSLFGKFREQWEKFKEQMETVKLRFETVQRGYEELIGTRTKQLDKPLEKIDALRVEGSIPVATITDTVEKAAKKQIASSASR